MHISGSRGRFYELYKFQCCCEFIGQEGNLNCYEEAKLVSDTVFHCPLELYYYWLQIPEQTCLTMVIKLCITSFTMLN